MKEDIKAGDEVVVTDSFGSFQDTGTVVKITKSFIALNEKGFFATRKWYPKDRAEKVIGSYIVL